jgi:CubicO group peptidase (beta-lactamase class C family)
MNRRLFLASSAAILTGCATSAPSAARALPFAAELDAALDRAMGLGVSPGLGVAVYTRDGAYARALGVTDLETGESADADTAFYIASATKPLTALTLAALHQRGVLDLDQTLAAFAPDAGFPPAARAEEVRLRNLLTHTSGLANDGIGWRVAFSGEHDPETLWRLLAATGANAEAPLGAFHYTNVGYNIATVLTDRRLGVAWQDLLQREIFAPLGMGRTSARQSQARSAGWRVAKPHMPSPEGDVRRIYLEKTDQTMQSAGGVIMSANDALRWLELMVEDGRVGGRQILPASVIAATREPLAEENEEHEGYQRQHYGLGWHIGPYRDDRLLHHFGSFAGFGTHVSYMPARGVGVAVFNNNNFDFGLIHALANYVYDKTGYQDADARFASALEGAASQRANLIPRLAADRANRAARAWTLTRPRPAYAGAYENEAFGRIEIAAEGEILTLRFGVLRAAAEPFTRPDSLRVEFVPGMGSAIAFEGEDAAPAALIFQGQRFARA